MSIKGKRIRSLNWDEEEKQLFRSVFKEFATTIENKSLDNNANKLKTKAWEEVHKKFNELNVRFRSFNQLKSQWKTMKISARKLKNSSESPSRSEKSNNYVDTMVNHTRSLKDQEHQKRMEILEVELNIQKEKLKSAILEREILEIRKVKELREM